jgi:hypothetical protein
LIEKFNVAGETEKAYLLQRLEAIRDYCDKHIEKHNQQTYNKNNVRKPR